MRFSIPLFLFHLGLVLATVPAQAADPVASDRLVDGSTPKTTAHEKTSITFSDPVRLMAGDKPVRTERPGYAAPCWADIDGDGKKDLLVGQFAGGKIKVYRNLGDQKLAEGEWLEADGKVAKIPGIW